MSDPSPTGARPTKLRLWPGVLLVAVQWFLWLAVPRLVPTTEAGYVAALGGAALTLVVFLWWMFFSRATGLERWLPLPLMIAGLLAAKPFLHLSIATAGMGMLYYFTALPVVSLLFVLWALLARNLSPGARRVTMIATVLAACGGWILLRTNGVSATGSDFRLRWSPTAEERLLAQADDAPAGALAAAPPGVRTAEWPGFRGRQRNGVVSGVRIETDWASSPPRELWRRPIGPGWSSFAVQGDYLYTQEQRGEDEMVACYRASTGEPVWRHRDPARFWESQGGAGPRATPTLYAGGVYTFGATGILNALNAADGSTIWSRNVVDDTGAETPYWGFSSSPLVTAELVVVATPGTLVAYDRLSGASRWSGPDGGGGYSSPHLLEIDGVEQILLLSSKGAVGLSPADGELLWRHEWPGSRIVQPALTPGGEILIGSDPIGTRSLSVRRGSGGWTMQERWTSNRLKPYFSDFVVHGDHAFGFDGSILASVRLDDGERNWKGGRYGNGQLVLLRDQSLLLVISEKGELALVEAVPDGFSELERLKVLEGKTWNHPVVVGDLLLIRNDREMAAYRLPLAAG